MWGGKHERICKTANANHKVLSDDTELAFKVLLDCEAFGSGLDSKSPFSVQFLAH